MHSSQDTIHLSAQFLQLSKRQMRASDPLSFSFDRPRRFERIALRCFGVRHCAEQSTQHRYDSVLTPDEETGSVASRPVLETAARSGRFSFPLVFEPARSNGNLVKSRKGTGIFSLTCHGRAAHAGRDPEAGRNAIVALAEYLPPVDEQLFLAWQRCAHDLGVNVSWQDVAGGSDGNLLAAVGLSTLDGLGPAGDHPHSPNEFVHLSSLAERAAITSRFLQQIASSDVPLPSALPREA